MFFEKNKKKWKKGPAQAQHSPTQTGTAQHGMIGAMFGLAPRPGIARPMRKWAVPCTSAPPIVKWSCRSCRRFKRSFHMFEVVYCVIFLLRMGYENEFYICEIYSFGKQYYVRLKASVSQVNVEWFGLYN